ncbi:tRNA (adenosine(37)-N6)-threonylcarbamoyltransferase complex ATPase subunit type 1 TsaE [Candidatus Saccharibacteria bacterium]|nr:tRNA (adenosine(37)-N6)-threonylcarbamoyltransferase complex ATPase subunit type 1 TsaE [Candidatus Saccharibacteria bacterium]
MIAKTEEELIKIGEQIGAKIKAPVVLELIGDVGAGKTTLTKGIARGLKIDDEITSPSYTLSKRYKNNNTELVHYDFYRLEDPGIMSEDLEESLSDENTITIIEWGNTVENILPENHPKITIKIRDDGSREVEIKNLEIGIRNLENEPKTNMENS